MAGSSFTIGAGTAQSSSSTSSSLSGSSITVQDMSGATFTCLNPAGLTINTGDNVLYVEITNPATGTNTYIIVKGN